MLKLESVDDLKQLYLSQVQESSTLEYKASAAVENADHRKQEIAKDVSAMANAEGGQFIYGMTDKDHLPAGLDDGHKPKPFTGLWFEQVIQQNVSPQIPDLKIRQIPSGNGNFYTVVIVPKSKTIHQVKDGRYYRRRNFRNDVMEDYEIREAIFRTDTPDLSLGIQLEPSNLPQRVIFLAGAPRDPIRYR